MNVSKSLSEEYRCTKTEVKGVSDEFGWWKHSMRIVWCAGTALSALGLLLLLAAAYIFPKWRRKKQSKLWLQMISAGVCFAALYASRDLDACKTPLRLLAVMYFGHAAFCLHLVCAWCAHHQLVTAQTFHESGDILRETAFAWLAPLPFDCLRFSLDTIEFPDVLFTQKIFKVTIGCYSVTMQDVLKLVDFLKDIGIYLPVFVCVLLSMILYSKVLFCMWKIRFSTNAISGHSKLHDFYGVGLLVLFFTLMSGVQFIFVVMYRFYSFTELDILLSLTTTYPAFIYSLVFNFGIKDTRQMWLSYIRRKIFKKHEVTHV